MTVSTGTETALSQSPVKIYTNIYTLTHHTQDHQMKKMTHWPYQKHQWTIIYQILIKTRITLTQAQVSSIFNSYYDHQRSIQIPIPRIYKITIADHYIGQ
jgi:hypothetical protein